MNKSLELTLRCLIDYFIKTSPLIFDDYLNREQIRGFGQIVALSIDRLYGTPFAASTSTSLSKTFQPAQLEDGRNPGSS
jgi:hypothetical protein